MKERLNIFSETVKRSIGEFAFKKEINKETVTQFLQDCRNLIELNNWGREYPVLYFYCNWSMHPNIDRNEFLYNFLGDISECFSGIENYEIAKHLKIKDLTKEILDLIAFSMNYIPFLVPDKFVEKLICQIFKNLENRIIHFPEVFNSGKDLRKFEIIIKRSQKAADYVDKFEKHKNPRLLKTHDYSKPIIVNSFMVKEVTENSLFFEVLLDKKTSELRNSTYKEIIILTGFSITINVDSNLGLNFQYGPVWDIGKQN